MAGEHCTPVICSKHKKLVGKWQLSERLEVTLHNKPVLTVLRPWENKSVLDLLLLLPLSSQLFHAKPKVQPIPGPLWRCKIHWELKAPVHYVKHPHWSLMQVSQNLSVCIIFLLPFPLQHCKLAKNTVLKSKKFLNRATWLVWKFWELCMHTTHFSLAHPVLSAPTASLSFLHFHKLFSAYISFLVFNHNVYLLKPRQSLEHGKHGISQCSLCLGIKPIIFPEKSVSLN